jgi:hypothetical protein
VYAVDLDDPVEHDARQFVGFSPCPAREHLGCAVEPLSLGQPGRERVREVAAPQCGF